ncbi:P-loop containing nucleoside triphosphate hydrolase protein [Dacryopinax primogenitus]|uniref:p-loop containing nucleoside triphosphate hydrolase protein n=1 Tax=Dacryopinax primogenitus (strain DJM 731) TaxID=1858805 RepID=M5FUE2_DACPD|nr:P-loop containing nucleoside triphosphate hydrolase protein [Dacryopinax primogenitus]EJT99838.1 P-loop containing nucleoside triphosphate hydrolase protein [Dacryopinax primogenitus]
MSDPSNNPIYRRLSAIPNIILVLSGKGGVGKSSVSVQLALSLYALLSRPRVALLDIDLTGPSIPRMLHLPQGTSVHQSTAGWVPAYADGEEQRLACMSTGLLLKRREESVVWRGPKKNAMIRQFLSEVRWGDDVDYLVIDTPPGTSDEHLSLLEHLSPLASRLSSVLVTTPQALSLVDCLKSLSFTRTVSLPLLGIIENLAGYVCPCCGEISNVFSTGGGEDLARKEGVRFLGRLPVDTKLVELLDGRLPEGMYAEEFKLLEAYKCTTNGKLFEGIVQKVLEGVERLGKGEEVPGFSEEDVIALREATSGVGH